METQELNATIEKLNRHFVDEILNGEYEVTDTDCNSVKIQTTGSGKEFKFWTSYLPVHVYGGFMILKFSEDENKILTETLEPLYRLAELERKRKEYEKLKAEFEPA